MSIGSIQRFDAVQKPLFSFTLAVPVISVAGSVAQLVVSLAQIMHGLAMAAFYALKNNSPETTATKRAYLNSAGMGAAMLTLGLVNIATLGLLPLCASLYFTIKDCKKAKTPLA